MCASFSNGECHDAGMRDSSNASAMRLCRAGALAGAGHGSSPTTCPGHQWSLQDQGSLSARLGLRCAVWGRPANKADVEVQPQDLFFRGYDSGGNCRQPFGLHARCLPRAGWPRHWAKRNRAAWTCPPAWRDRWTLLRHVRGIGTLSLHRTRARPRCLSG